MNEINEFLLPLFVEALALRADHAEIDRLYNTDPLRFRELAKTHKFFNVYLYDQGTLDKAIYCRKVLGLLVGSANLDSLIRNSWPKVWKYVKRHKGKLDMADMMNNISSREDDLSTFNSKFMVGLYLAHAYASEVIISEEMESALVSTIQQHIIRNSFEDCTLPSWVDTDEVLKSKAETLLQRIERKYDVTCSGIHALDDEIFPHDKTINCVTDFETIIVAEIFCSTPITRLEFIESLALYIREQPEGISITEAAKYMQSAMKIRILSRAYKELKKRYFDSSYDLMEAQITSLKTAISNLEQKLKDQEEASARQKITLESEILRLREDYKASLERQVIDLQRENQRLQMSLEQETAKNQELNALREYFFQHQQDPPADDSLQGDLVALPAIKCVIVGGHPIWQSKLREKVPDSFVFIPADARSFDTLLLKGATVVIVNATYCSHALYYRVVENIADSSKLSYISATNINATLKALEGLLS